MSERAETDPRAMAHARRFLWGSAWLGVAALLVWATVPDDGEGAARRPVPPIERLLGPFASLAARVQWVRVDAALRRGDVARAYARAESALRLDPSDPLGWILLAHHLAFERGSLLREPDRDVRARWIQAGLETLRRGERVSREPAALLFERGVTLAFQASLADEDRAWPRSAAQAWRLSSEAFQAAAAQGYPRAAEAAALARERAEAASSQR